jgi:hypothetical protein
VNIFFLSCFEHFAKIFRDFNVLFRHILPCGNKICLSERPLFSFDLSFQEKIDPKILFKVKEM